MSKHDEFIEFKIETAENMSKHKIVLLAHPIHKEMLSMLLYKIQKGLDKLDDNK